MRTVSDPINAEDIVLEVANQAGVAVADLRGDYRRHGNKSIAMQERRAILVRARDAAVFAMAKRGVDTATMCAVLGVSQPTISACMARAKLSIDDGPATRGLAQRALAYLEKEKDGA
jgi:hypothetical protein